jgi:4'-phosphopantetheinyl transferase EntD
VSSVYEITDTREARAPNPAAVSPAIPALFPASVVAAELRGPGNPSLLHAEEFEHIRRAVRKRAEEFAAGRLCARRALMEFGIEDFPLRMRENRTPAWPGGIAGSITHTKEYCAVVVAKRGACRSIGLDAEIVCRVTPDLWKHICTDQELDWLSTLPEADRPNCAALIFSAKEAFYKCQYDLTGEFLDFQDLQLDLAASDLAEERWAIRPARDILITRHAEPPYLGRFFLDGELIVTGSILLSGELQSQPK